MTTVLRYYRNINNNLPLDGNLGLNKVAGLNFDVDPKDEIIETKNKSNLCWRVKAMMTAKL